MSVEKAASISSGELAFKIEVSSPRPSAAFWTSFEAPSADEALAGLTSTTKRFVAGSSSCMRLSRLALISDEGRVAARLRKVPYQS
jgi:hypothetical protein